MAIKLLVAVDQQFGIGYKNDLLYKVPADLKRFKELTTNHYVLMGSRTYESLPVEKLPNRINVVLTKNKDYKVPTGVFKMDSVEHVLNHYNSGKQDKDLFVIGGSTIYAQMLEHVDEVLLTYIDAEAENADTFFNRRKLEELFYLSGMQRNYCEKNNLTFFYFTYKRKV